MIYTALRAVIIFRPAAWIKKFRKHSLSEFFGGATRNRTGDEGVADLCLTAWLWRRMKFSCLDNRTWTYCYVRVVFGADYGARTRHLDLGKVALYQMS